MTTTTASAVSPKKGLHIGLWAVQGLLALAFLGAGVTKVSQPIAELAQQMAWAGYTPAALVRFIGAVEVLGALGLILPAATRVLPILTPLAAAGLTTVMVLAAGTHLTHGEAPMIVPNVMLGALSALVAWGRFQKAPISAR